MLWSPIEKAVFSSDEFETVMKLNGIRHVKSTPYPYLRPNVLLNVQYKHSKRAWRRAIRDHLKPEPPVFLNTVVSTYHEWNFSSRAPCG